MFQSFRVLPLKFEWISDQTLSTLIFKEFVDLKKNILRGILILQNNFVSLNCHKTVNKQNCFFRDIFIALEINSWQFSGTGFFSWSLQIFCQFWANYLESLALEKSFRWHRFHFILFLSAFLAQKLLTNVAMGDFRRIFCTKTRKSPPPKVSLFCTEPSQLQWN